ncbi:MAG: hypothetical protein U0105_06655 [Candidatus Obscuribacterales bacterium]|jgi:hypothetical protein
MASRKSTKYLAKEVGEFATIVATPSDNQIAPPKPVVKAFREAFARGGLDEVDKLIDSINKCLLADGATLGLADGCASELDDAGNPAYLCIRFKEYEARNPYFQQWIELN